ncbi:MAG: hypothetical protein IJL02_00700 [Methanobrevibacter sp.]|uniref:hypothetical protein n=1 Tax=Methanobrevibacter sp. TaxID=66852 RepID=UPI0025DB9C9E|nr:hypothetical protein [Methanobrevibacter sp.]MBQ6098366.1 hypothetical protein [Methanobrevibacter sp.]
MDRKDYEVRTKVIRETFNDERQLICIEDKDELKLDENVYSGGDIFITDDGEFIDLEFQTKDFDENELVKYVELAENLYEKHGKNITIYLICPKGINVSVRECDIKSEATFTIKLACIPEDPCEMVLKHIKDKIKRNEILNGDDLHALSMLQVVCRKEDRNYYRREYFKIINRLQY